MKRFTYSQAQSTEAPDNTLATQAGAPPSAWSSAGYNRGQRASLAWRARNVRASRQPGAKAWPRIRRSPARGRNAGKSASPWRSLMPHSWAANSPRSTPILMLSSPSSRPRAAASQLPIRPAQRDAHAGVVLFFTFARVATSVISSAARNLPRQSRASLRGRRKISRCARNDICCAQSDKPSGRALPDRRGAGASTSLYPSPAPHIIDSFAVLH